MNRPLNESISACPQEGLRRHATSSRWLAASLLLALVGCDEAQDRVLCDPETHEAYVVGIGFTNMGRQTAVYRDVRRAPNVDRVCREGKPK